VLEFVGTAQSPPHHIWLGASASTQEDLERMVPPLLETPAAVRFLSLEPLLESVDLRRVEDDEIGAKWDVLDGGIGWVIVGCESGPKARPMELAAKHRVKYQIDECVWHVVMKQIAHRAHKHPPRLAPT
jgi:protein gp37